MKKTDQKSLLLIGLCAIGMILVLAGLYALSPLSEHSMYRGSFYRYVVPQSQVKLEHTLDLKLNSFYISGLSEDKIYLNNVTAPLRLVEMNRQLKDTQHIRLQVEGLDSIVDIRGFRTFVEPPYFYMAHGVEQALLRGKTGIWKARHFLSESVFFADAVAMDSTTFAISYFSKSQQSLELALLQKKEPVFSPQVDILESQGGEGMFSVSGMLHYSSEFQLAVYLYRYRNQYMVMNQSLRLLNRFNTLDTISKARIKVDRIDSENSYTLTSQPSITQKNSAVYGNKLFVESAILSKGELEKDFREHHVIDVYDILKGKYIASFYLPRIPGQSLKSFKAIGNQMITVQGQYLKVYSLLELPSSINSMP